MDRKEVLLKATYDLLLKQHESGYVLDILETTTHYDDAECDGWCLLMDIAHELNIEDAPI